MKNRIVYDWEAIREEFKKSDLSIEAFSKLKGFCKSSGHKHLNDIALQKRQIQAESEAIPESKNAEPDFISVEISEPDIGDLTIPDVKFIKTSEMDAESKPMQAKENSPIDLRINNVSITLHTGFEKSDLRNVLEVVRELC